MGHRGGQLLERTFGPFLVAEVDQGGNVALGIFVGIQGPAQSPVSKRRGSLRRRGGPSRSCRFGRDAIRRVGRDVIDKLA